MRSRIASALSTEAIGEAAAVEAALRVADRLGGPADFVCVFFTHHHRDSAEAISRVVRERLGEAVVGCTGEAVVGDGREVEEGPALVVWAARLPGATVDIVHARFFHADRRAGFIGLPDFASLPDLEAVVVLAEPFSFPAAGLLRYAVDRFPGVRFTGGMASGGRARGENRLLVGTEVHDSGAAAAIIRGDAAIHTLVSQGCRPVGKTFVVTKAERNLLLELSGRPALEQLEQVVEELEGDDRRRAARGIHVGIVVDEYQETFDRGDFLVRAVLRGDPDTGAVEIGEVVDVGRTVQFQVRDADSASEDIQQTLKGLDAEPSGGLLFTCNGRGSRMFVLPDHDAQAIHHALGDVPVAGLFCQGEIGAIGGQSHLHGFTASMAFFE